MPKTINRQEITKLVYQTSLVSCLFKKQQQQQQKTAVLDKK